MEGLLYRQAVPCNKGQPGFDLEILSGIEAGTGHSEGVYPSSTELMVIDGLSNVWLDHNCHFSKSS